MNKTYKALLAQAPDKRRSWMGGYIEAQATRLLRPETRLDRGCSLIALGFDSLMAVELMYCLRVDLGFDVSLPQLLETPSISALAAVLADRLEADGPAIEATEPIAGDEGMAALSFQYLLARVDCLREDQVDDLVSMLPEGNHGSNA